jgi:adenylate kinase
MKLIFVGKQASGKGTQGKVIAQKLNLEHISTGDLLRNAGSKLKNEIHSYIDKGNLVPNELIIKLLKEKLKTIDKGFILDGFPRNLDQAKELDKEIQIDKVIEIFISDQEAKTRLTSRLNCPDCGAVFNKITNPPKKENTCDICNAQLFSRTDDSEEEAIDKRLQTYQEQTKPILEHYKNNLIKINGEQPIEKVTQDILEYIK